MFAKLKLALAALMICGASTAAVADDVTVSPASENIFARGAIYFTASGGTGNYTWSVVGNGTIGASGNYIAGSTIGATDTVQVQDDNGLTATATVTVTSEEPTITVTANSTEPGCMNVIAENSTPGVGFGGPVPVCTVSEGSSVTLTIVVTGDNGPVDWFVSGPIIAPAPNSDGTYTLTPDLLTTTGPSGNFVQIYLDDIFKQGNLILGALSIVVQLPIAISPVTATVAPGTTQSFTATGGSGTYTFNVSGPSGGSIDPATGLYTAGSSCTLADCHDTVEVADDAGHSAVADVHVAIPPSVSAVATSNDPRCHNVTGGGISYPPMCTITNIGDVRFTVSINGADTGGLNFLAAGYGFLTPIHNADGTYSLDPTVFAAVQRGSFPFYIYLADIGPSSSASFYLFYGGLPVPGLTLTANSTTPSTGCQNVSATSVQPGVVPTCHLAPNQEVVFTVTITNPLFTPGLDGIQDWEGHGVPTHNLDGTYSFRIGSFAGSTSTVALAISDVTQMESIRAVIQVIGEPDPLTLTPPVSTVATGSSVTFTAFGGSGGYTWSIPSNRSGAVVHGDGASLGNYIAGLTSGVQDTVKVTDSSGATATGVVNVISSPAVAVRCPAYPTTGLGVVYGPAENTPGMLLFEDLWPVSGDLDFNDETLAWYYTMGVNGDGSVGALTLDLDVLAIGANLKNGIYLHLPLPSTQPIWVIDQDGNSITPMAHERDIVLPLIPGNDDTRRLYTDQLPFINTEVTTAMQTPKHLSFTIGFGGTPGILNNHPSVSLDPALMPFDLFIARSDQFSHQVHLPQFKGTDAMTGSALFGSGDDRSNVDLTAQGGPNNSGRWFVNKLGMPFALNVPEVIAWPKERKPIDSVYRDLATFASSAGAAGKSWFASANIDLTNAFTGNQHGDVPPGAKLVGTHVTVAQVTQTAATLPAMVDLGNAGGSATVSGINAHGVVAGNSYTSGSSGPQVGFTWSQYSPTQGYVQYVGPFGTSSAALAINDSGQVAGWSDLPDGSRHAILWSERVGTIDLGTLPGETNSFAVGINNAGQIVGGSGDINNPSGHGFIWQNGAMTDIGSLGGISTALAINKYGEVAGTSFDAAGNKQVVSWTHAGGMVNLGTLLPAGSADAPSAGPGVTAINAAGQLTGTSRTEPNLSVHGFVSGAGGLTDLGTLSPTGVGGDYVTPAAINDSGMIVGQDNVYSLPAAFAWTQSGGIAYLGTLVDPRGTTPLGSHARADFSEASAVNGFGQVAGVSTSQFGGYHAAYWTPQNLWVDLGTVGGSGSWATQENDYGQVAGWSYSASDTNTHAVLWNTCNGPR
jgi:LruC domain-containing protein